MTLMESSTPPRAEMTPRRASILDETLRIVGERGYHGFGIQELAERCGLTKPGLLHHFGSKDQLLIALLNDRDARSEADLGQLFLEGYDSAADPDVQRDLFRQGLLAVVERAVAQPDLMRLQVVLRSEAINPDHPAHAYFAARQKEKLERLALRVAPFSADPQSTARRILATMSGLEQQWLSEGKGFDMLAEWGAALKILLQEQTAIKHPTGSRDKPIP
jgi:AcrR family transcriptional regulator